MIVAIALAATLAAIIIPLLFVSVVIGLEARDEAQRESADAYGDCPLVPADLKTRFHTSTHTQGE